MYRIESVLIATGLIAVITLPLAGQDAAEIVRRANEKMQGESSRAQVTMTIVRPSWQRSVSLRMWSKGRDYALILVTAPAGEEGIAYLKRGNEMWNWIPDIGRTVKLPPSMMSQSWMGSDFSNNDLVRESSIVTDYTHALVGDSVIDGYEVYKIEMTPKPTAPVVWDRVVTFISKDEYLMLRSEYYDEDGDLVRVLKASDVEMLGGRLIPTRYAMVPLDEPGNKTVLVYEEIAFNMGIPTSFFSLQNMKRVG